MLESKQERIAALEKQVDDLMQDRKFLRTQIENLTSSRSVQAFAPPTSEGRCPKGSGGSSLDAPPAVTFDLCFAVAPKPSKGQHSDKSRKRERASCSSSDGSQSGSEASDSSEASAASSEHRRKKHHKEKKRSKKTKDYSRKRGSRRSSLPLLLRRKAAVCLKRRFPRRRMLFLVEGEPKWPLPC